MSTDVLQEFLVKLGYKVDSASSQKFSKSIAAMNTGVVALGATVVGVSYLAYQGMREFAHEMEELNYTAQLANSSANSINSMSKAMQQFGFKPGQIEGIVTGFASMIAASPGLEAMMKSMGVALSPDKAIEFFNVMRKLEQMPEPVAIRTAAEFGVDVNSYRLIRGHIGEMAREWAEVDAANRKVGNNLDTQVKQGREFSNVLRDIGNQIDAISNKLMGVSIEKFGMRWVKTIREELELVMGAIGGGKAEKEKIVGQVTEKAASTGPFGAAATSSFMELLKAMSAFVKATTPEVVGATPDQKENAAKTKEMLNAPQLAGPRGTKLGSETPSTEVQFNQTNHINIETKGSPREAAEATHKSIKGGIGEYAKTARNVVGGSS